jgi:hypothetical protein
MLRALLIALLLEPLLTFAALGQAPLPAVDEVAWKPFRENCRLLLQALEKQKTPFPATTTKKLNTLLDSEPEDKPAALNAVKKLLDARCLIGVHINPEGRVKVARGPAAALLQRGRPTVLLVRIHNEGGVTGSLTVNGPGLCNVRKKGPGQWLEATLPSSAALKSALSGHALEYRLLQLTARQAGKREATFTFDVGQGSQDLGFRAEVPILFTIKNP